MTKWFVIGISGVTCGGKSTLAQNLYNFFTDPSSENFFKNNLKIGTVNIINQDEYFHAIDSPQHKRIDKLNHINWEIMTAIDMNKMCSDIENTLAGDNSMLQSVEDIDDDIQLESINLLNILILEGFLIFNHPFILELCNIKFHLHVPYEKCFQRRKTRLYNPPDVMGYFETCVWPMYEKHFKEFGDRNDVLLLNGELIPQMIFNYVLKCISDVL